jgi:hypothetical protein
MNLDDLLKQIQEDELSDTNLLPPIQYAKLRGLYPQRVYKAIRDDRNKRTIWKTCECGRLVVIVEAADKLFGFKTVSEEDEDGSSGDND